LKKENKDTVRMINRLSELLRLTLNRDDTQTIEFGREIEFIEKYLAKLSSRKKSIFMFKKGQSS
jgi:LytS/YehU family sensor histidine kinase